MGDAEKNGSFGFRQALNIWPSVPNTGKGLLKGYIYESYDIEIIEMEIPGNHIHLTVSFPPLQSIGEEVRSFVTNSSAGSWRSFKGNHA